MKLNKKKFLETNFERSTKDVEVPEARFLFDLDNDDEVPVLTCQSLMGRELAYVREGRDDVANKRLEAFVTAFRTASTSLAGDTAKLLGIDNDVPAEAVFIHRTLEKGVVGFDFETARKLFAVKPVTATHLSNVIQGLTGEGQVAIKKPESSSQTPASESQSNSSSGGEDTSISIVPTSVQVAG